jgi:hypothetical protein
MNIKFISLGHRCSTASILKKLNLKSESYPFDWTVSKLDVIQDCIQTNFEYFMNIRHYLRINNNHIVNTFYERSAIQIGNIKGTSFFKLKLGMNHFYVLDEEGYSYYERCITRLNNVLLGDARKIIVYIHFLISLEEYNLCCNTFRNEIYNFTDFIKSKTSNIFGIYFILVQDSKRDSPEIESIVNNDDLIVYVIHVNKNFEDGGCTFSSDCNREQTLIENIIKSYCIEECDKDTEPITL